MPTKYNLFFIFLGVLILKIYFLFNTSYDIDELSNYVYFQKTDLIYPLSNYPAPNNHVFFSFLSNILLKLFPFKNLYIARFISLVASFLGAYVFYKIIKKKINENIAVLAFCAFCFFYPNLYFSLVGRGYAFLLLFVILGYYLLDKMINETTSWKVAVGYIICCALGFYTVPVFLYPFLVFNVAILLATTTVRKKAMLILYSAIISIVVIALYMPIILNVGLESITHNSYVKSLTYAEFFANLEHHINYIFSFLFSVPDKPLITLTLGGMVILLSVVNYFIHKSDFLSLLSMLILVLFIPIITAQCVLPFARTFIFLQAPILYSLFMLYKKLAEHFPKLASRNIVYMGCIAVIAWYTLVWYKTSKSAFHTAISYTTMNEAKSCLDTIQHLKAQHIYTNAGYICSYLEYVLSNQEKKEFNVYGTKFLETNKIDATLNYDLFILSKSPNDDYKLTIALEKTLPQKYNLMFDNNHMEIWKRIDY